ncbi:MAG: methylmalonyl Co-A mutase-associated GTPase MeaB [Myxococcota bacterium]
MADLAGRLLAGERSAVPDALNLVDDRRPERREAALLLLDALERGGRGPGAPRVGLTGSPGAGKSTLLDALVRRLRTRGTSVGIVAVDPSSQLSGGALLGDRVRVRSGAGDPGVFFRSMAARERLGGLADATRASVTILAAVFDRVFVETVGVGQSETEVAALVDTVVYVAQPGAGDTLQFMKAGILEHPDVFVVNKADRGPSAERSATELQAGLGLGVRSGDWRPPVLLASARDATGIDEILDALEAHREFLERSGELARRRRRGCEVAVRQALLARYGSHGLECLGREASVSDRLGGEPEVSSFARILSLGREIEDALRKPEGC